MDQGPTSQKRVVRCSNSTVRSDAWLGPLNWRRLSQFPHPPGFGSICTEMVGGRVPSSGITSGRKRRETVLCRATAEAGPVGSECCKGGCRGGASETKLMATVTKLVVKSAQRSKSVKCLVDDVSTKVPVTPELYARYQELFRREIPSDLQKRRLSVLRRLMAAAFKAGQNSD